MATRERVDEFEQWATEQGYTLEPAFHWRGAESDGDEESQRRHVVTPLITLAVYTATDIEEKEEGQEETLQAVYPHVAGKEVRTIQDGVETLESIARGAEQLAHDMSEQPVVSAE